MNIVALQLFSSMPVLAFTIALFTMDNRTHYHPLTFDLALAKGTLLVFITGSNAIVTSTHARNYLAPIDASCSSTCCYWKVFHPSSLKQKFSHFQLYSGAFPSVECDTQSKKTKTNRRANSSNLMGKKESITYFKQLYRCFKISIYMLSLV